ncbi:MAG: hypothetical protein QN178_16990, partial [Armatimonadota bacterium]|nr:hypothetical protein [Armatimonadota bacterium]
YRTTGRGTALFQPRTPRMDLFVGMTTYGGNTPGQVTFDSLTLVAREDWTRTMAFVLDKGDASVGRRIRLNVRGREPAGIVEPGPAYEQVRQRIVAGLQSLRDLQGRPLVRRVYRREELYAGPWADEGPDLLALFEEGVGGVDHMTGPAATPVPGSVGVASERDLTGTHRPEGIFVACGRGIRQGAEVAARIVDVCPTVLHLLGVPVPADADGRVLTEIFSEAIVTAEAPGADRVAAVVAGGMPGPASLRDAGDDVYAADDQALVEARLRKLGYLD